LSTLCDWPLGISAFAYVCWPCCLGDTVVERRTRDQKVADDSDPAGSLSSQLGQLSLPSLRGR